MDETVSHDLNSDDEPSPDAGTDPSTPAREPSSIDRAMQERRSRTTAVAGAAEGEPDVAVLVPAAGSGTRMGDGPRKQYRELGGDPLLICTLRVFERCDAVGHIIVAAPSEDVRRVSDRLQEAGLRKLTAVVEGGASRQASVRNALRAVPTSVNVVLVHDAVRPFVRSHHVSTVVDAVREHGAASLAVPVVDTLRRQEGGSFGATVDRDGLYRMQTPQGFRRDWLETAHREARAKEIQATDDVELVQQRGHSVRCVEGSAYNVKITTPTDWSLAKAIWPRWCEGKMGGESASSRR